MSNTTFGRGDFVEKDDLVNIRIGFANINIGSIFLAWWVQFK